MRGQAGFATTDAMRGTVVGMFHVWAAESFIRDVLIPGLRLDPEARLRQSDIFQITRDDVQAAEQQALDREYTRLAQELAERQGISVREAEERMERAAQSGPPYPTISAGPDASSPASESSAETSAQHPQRVTPNLDDPPPSWAVQRGLDW